MKNAGGHSKEWKLRNVKNWNQSAESVSLKFKWYPTLFSSNTEGSRGPTWCTSVCFAIFYHIHLFRFLFSKADIWASCPKMSQTPQEHAHNSPDAPPVTGRSLVAPLIYIVVYCSWTYTHTSSCAHTYTELLVVSLCLCDVGPALFSMTLAMCCNDTGV